MTSVPPPAAQPSSMEPLDVLALWDFSQPALSEARFRQALVGARGDDVLILQTQIARSHGLRRDFARAREILAGIEERLPQAGPEARVRHALELGRTWASATHTPAEVDEGARQRARSAYASALAQARAAQLDALAIDAVHMLAFVDTAPADQLKWAQEALALALASSQPAAQRWEASIRNNLGYALNQLGRHEEALVQLQQAVQLRGSAPANAQNAERTRQARWMVARTLRYLERNDDALAMQLQLEAENDAAGTPDVFVYEELEALYRGRGDEARASHYAQRRAVVAK